MVAAPKLEEGLLGEAGHGGGDGQEEGGGAEGGVEGHQGRPGGEVQGQEEQRTPEGRGGRLAAQEEEETEDSDYKLGTG